MKINFCTLFDSYYLTRGLALYYSLEAACDDFHLYIFSFDTKSYDILSSLKLKYVTIIPLSELETPELLAVKPSRTYAEYCWTCTASTIWHAIKNYDLDHCTYLDADMLFFSSPDPIFKEIGEKSVGITPHNFSPKLKSAEVYGKFCVQFVYFRNNTTGLKALDWWRKSCIDWCFARLEDDRYGDQKYLDYFSEKFLDVCEISHPGAGLAHWNIDNYTIMPVNGNIRISPRKTITESYYLIFYHYQGLKFRFAKRSVKAEASFIKVDDIILQNIYKPYIKRLVTLQNEITGKREICEPVVFYRSFKNIIGQSLKSFLKQSSVFRKIYYLVLRQRYSKPKQIGAEIKNNIDL